VVAGLLIAGCSSSSSAPGNAASGSAAPASGATALGGPATTAGHPLRIMVTNDDGVSADGIDAVVEALRQEPNVEVTVVAPLKNQSGTGGKTTPGQLVATDATTKSGYPAKAIDGYPADTVTWALGGGLDFRPDIVISGNNAGQNLGPYVDISGTVGAARAAARAGIPAVAISQGLADPTDYPTGSKVLIDWLRAHRADLAQLTPGNAPAGVLSFNVPSCPAATPMRGVKEITTAKDVGTRNILDVNCASTATNFTDDIDAFANGFATQSVVNVEPGQ
jgi:5'-nucleotidase